MSKPKLHIFVPGLPQPERGEERHGDSVLVYDDDKNAVLIDGGEWPLFEKTRNEMKRLGIKHVCFILTHWHGDHDCGLKFALEDPYIIVDEIYAPNPNELKLVPKDEGYDEYNRAVRRINLAKELKKKVVYPAPGKRVGHWVGKIRVWMWRRKANPNDYVDYQVNNTSMQIYFPDLEVVAPGDAITTTEHFFKFVDQDKNDWPITGFLINHHGNGIGGNAPLYKKHGAKICWYSDWEPKGVGIGGTSRWRRACDLEAGRQVLHVRYFLWCFPQEGRAKRGSQKFPGWKISQTSRHVYTVWSRCWLLSGQNQLG